jgi:hypothetical protein
MTTTIRVWKLRSLEHQILPTRKAIETLAELLSKVGAGGVTDIIWGPDIECFTVNGDGVNKILTPVQLESGEVLYRLHEDWEQSEVVSNEVCQNEVGATAADPEAAHT